MNILLLNWRDTNHPQSGGAEIVTMEHAKGWVRAGHQVTWMTSLYKGAKRTESLSGVMFLRQGGMLTLYIHVAWFLIHKGHRFDVIVDEVHGFPFFSLLFTKTPVVVYIHEIAGDIWDYMFRFPKNVIGKMLERLYFRLYKHCLFWTIAPSTVAELVARGIPKKNCYAIPNPIILPKNIDVTNSKKEHNPTYLFVSRVVRMKGIEEVIKAFSFIVRAQKNAALWIIGGGEPSYLRELKAMVSEYGIVRSVLFLGPVKEREKFNRMARSHLMLHASVKEGWGLVVLEAAYAGTPAIVYNVTGLKDVVKNGQTGVVVSDNSPQEMATQALKLYANKERYKTLQKQGRLWAQSLSWDDVIPQSLRILTKSCLLSE